MEPARLGGRSPSGRGGGRASAALPLLDDVTTSPASRRLASARPALAPKCEFIFARTLRSRESGGVFGYHRIFRFPPAAVLKKSDPRRPQGPRRQRFWTMEVFGLLCDRAILSIHIGAVTRFPWELPHRCRLRHDIDIDPDADSEGGTESSRIAGKANGRPPMPGRLFRLPTPDSRLPTPEGNAPGCTRAAIRLCSQEE